MTVYNSVLQVGVAKSLSALELGTFAMIFIIALTIDWFIVAPLAKAIVKKLSSDKLSFIQMIMMMSVLMVLFMCTAMSFIATLLEGYQGSLATAFAHTFMLNIMVALPLQVLVAGPLARSVFKRMFPTPTTALAN
ncbi:DUF2798 domain-containing protein [Alginatibacterium sediminis]|nr:DUF2798 domain-containing protein [Alginatibacterium sediminis]